jgi:hypothetical protein
MPILGKLSMVISWGNNRWAFKPIDHGPKEFTDWGDCRDSITKHESLKISYNNGA